MVSPRSSLVCRSPTMRVRISHLTSYVFDTPAASVIQMLRLTPRNHDGQYVARWRIDVSTDCRLDQHEDAFGNITHVFTADGPLSELAVAVEGEVETRDTQGIVRGVVERFPPSLYLRETPLTTPDADIASFATASRDAADGNVLNLLHLMLGRLHNSMSYDKSARHAPVAAAETFALKRGVAQDFAHIFIAASRSLVIPARYVAGYVHQDGGASEQESGHAWAEAFVPELGWVAFDAANGLCASDAHVRVAVGLDCLGAAPLRGTCRGDPGERVSVKVRVEQAAQQIQS
jgi:transglutaminase-like putative cysteine protease